ncbi:hypothetical protein [Ligilactobacillus acidipiscis]|uniref:hypothetical protein n=1 Tax=Ligilactobacillus acidipiscis TaxID=89059 RepID=UPI0023F876EB|nr:hypothetical protein [Ligilactobacillus acidipiscis]WEV56691.1 hypothetical protein OZX66_10770 [Ligilactobacillus acidipiscis]
MRKDFTQDRKYRAVFQKILPYLYEIREYKIGVIESLTSQISADINEVLEQNQANLDNIIAMSESIARGGKKDNQ